MLNAVIDRVQRGCSAITLALLAGTTMLITPPVQAASGDEVQNYPQKPVTLLIGFSGVSDVFARVIGQRLSERLGQPVIVDSRPGASGAISSAALAKAKPDGYTLGFVISTHTTNPYIQKSLPYDTLSAFTPISMLGRVPVTLVANPKSSGIQDFAQFREQAESIEGGLSYGSAGTGGMTHLTGELLQRAMGVDMVHISYRGGAAAITNLLGGQIPVQFPTVTLIHPMYQAKDDRIKVVAIASATRSTAMPDVPTFVELGYPDVVVDEWYALMAPAGTPQPIVRKLNQVINEVLLLPDVQQKIVGMNVAGSSPEEVDVFIRSEMARWSKIIADPKFKLE